MADQDLLYHRRRERIIEVDREYGFSEEYTEQRLNDLDLRYEGHKHAAGKLVAKNTNKAVAFYECIEPRCSLYMRPITKAAYKQASPTLN